MHSQADLKNEREYTAHVQQILYGVIAQSEKHAGFQDETIKMMLSDAWDELRMRPTALSPQDLEQLNTEIDRFLARKSFSESQAERYRKMLMKPFFARVDFAEAGGGTEKIVIGLYSLKDLDGSLLVHDWRAPVCSLYYDSLPGEASYESPGGVIEGTMTLKRQYVMDNGRLKYYVDTEYSIDDGMLLEMLSAATTSHMRNIVSTIQREQNAAIRNERARVLSVTGGAGSGKTSVAMHRAAYLLHRHRDHLSARDMVVLSPSDAFTEYISTVLPDLGEENTETETLSHLIAPLIGRSVETPAHQYERMLQANDATREAVDWLYSEKHVEALDMYVDKLQGFYPHFATVTLDKHVLATGRELQKLYQVDNAPLNPAQRLSRIRAIMDNRLRDWEQSFYPQYEKQFIGSYRGKELDFIVRMAVAKRLLPVKNALRRMLDADPLSLYREAISGTPGALRLPAPGDTDPIPWELAPGVAYLMVRLGFARPETRVKYLLIDEAQDYSHIALRFMSVFYPNAHVTLLGDPNQRTLAGLSPCRPEAWGPLFGEDKAPLLHLTKSYRSTREITGYCDQLLPDDDTPECFGRSGDQVQEVSYDPDKLKALFARWEKKGHKRIALITRSDADARRIHRDFPDAHYMDGEDDSIHKGLSVCACHVTKGLEFDAVCVVWPKSDTRKDEMRRLYTACSRALHALVVCREA